MDREIKPKDMPGMIVNNTDRSIVFRLPEGYKVFPYRNGYLVVDTRQTGKLEEKDQ